MFQLNSGKTTMRALCMSSALLVSACGTTGWGTFDSTAWETETEANAPKSAVEAYIREGHKALADNKLERASRLFNSALKLDVTNANLQFLNSYTYHLMGIKGDSAKLELAEQGLKLTLKFDPGHLAARYQLGLLYMDQRRFGIAQGHFAAVALHRPDDVNVLYNLAASSYYSRDPQTAEAALTQLAKIDPEAASKPDVLRAQMMTKAALNDPQAAHAFLRVYEAQAHDDKTANGLKRRLRAWSGFYEHDAKIILAQGNPFPADTANPFGGNQANPFGTDQANPFGTDQADPFGMGQENPFSLDETQTDRQGRLNEAEPGPEMVVVDVVLIGTQEDVRESRGVNLLNGLQLQFGDPLTGAAGYGVTTNRIKDNLNSGLAESTQTITRSISIPAVSYSLNIANSADANNEILAKPSLVAQSGQTSEFFSGTEILAAAVSGGDGDSVSVQKEVGVKLAVTPEALDNDLIRLHVVAERTFLTDPSNSVVFEFRLDTTKTNVNATVTMRYGETLILGGLSERETSRSADGVPGLMDIPGLNLFFSERTERHFERSILILMTPRRPQYTRQSQENRERTIESLSDVELDIERLARRHEDWFTPRPTFTEIYKRLQHHDFFEEFRQGDVKIESWRDDSKVLEKFTALHDPSVIN